MAESPNHTSISDAPTTHDEESPELLSFTLQVVSPSVGVSSPLSFSRLPSTTTVKELKAKIRDALPSKPTDESQRLIHRGRMLGRDGDTMLDIFGQETIGNPEPQTLHLVLRPTTADGPSTALPNLTPAAGPYANPIVPELSHPRPQSTPAIAPSGLPAPPHFPHQPQVLFQAQHNYNNMVQNIQQLQREAHRLRQEMGLMDQTYSAQHGILGGQQAGLAHAPGISREGSPFQPSTASSASTIPNYMQNLMAQQQQQRTMNGIPTGIGAGPSALRSQLPGSGRSSPALRPDSSTTSIREGVGPNGERWQVVVEEHTTTIPLHQSQNQPHIPHLPHHHHHHHHHLEQQRGNTPRFVARNPVRDIIAQADHQMRAATPDTQGRETNQIPGEPPSGTPRSNTPLGIPPAAASVYNTGSNRDMSPSARSQLHMPANSLTSTSNGFNINQAVANLNSPHNPTVYLLSSPTGPRALLVTDSSSFYTPRVSRSHNTATTTAQPQGPANDRGGPVVLPEFRNRQGHRNARRNAQQANNPPLVPVAAHANPEAGAVGAQAGPMLWLLVRLIGFVWFFTSSGTSWTRWLMVTGVAFIIFLYNTGLFNGLAAQILAPIRQHLEALIPLAGPDAALVPALNAAAIPRVEGPPADLPAVQPGPRGELDPAQVAARLLAQQRRERDAGWLRTQIRRVEHSLLLFVASLVPGIGERHIAAREAEANERQRELDAAAAAANSAANPEGNAEGNAEDENAPTEGVEGAGNAAQPQEEQDRQAEQPAAAPAPLIET